MWKLLLMCVLNLVSFLHISLINYSGFKYYFNSEKQQEVEQLTLFANYLVKFGKSYETKEFNRRFKYFQENLKKIESLNDGRNAATFNVNKFTDLSEWELRQLLSPQLGYRDCDSKKMSCGDRTLLFSSINRSNNKEIPPSLDWRQKDVVGPVIDQLHCPICWAASIAGVMESMAAINGYGFNSLSIQQLMDCSYYPGDERTGCRKGRPLSRVFEFLCTYHTRLAAAADYPFTLAIEQCKGVQGAIALESFDNDCNMKEENETRLVEAISRGPVTALVDALHFFNYDHGVITYHCQVTEKELNHAVQIVGYDTTSDPPYYIVKNSWGVDWGENGYARLAIGSNQCGIAYSIGILNVTKI